MSMAVSKHVKFCAILCHSRWKVREGGTSSCCVDLPSGNFVKIINDAYQRMKELTFRPVFFEM